MAIEFKYVALKPLPVQMPDGERLTLQPGDEIPAEIVGRWVDVYIETGKVAAVGADTPSSSKRVRPRTPAAV